MTATMVLSLTIVGVLLVVLGILRLRHLALQDLVLGLMGAITGLLLGALASVPLSKLPSPFGGVLPVTMTVVFTLGLIALVLSRRAAILKMAPFLAPQTEAGQELAAVAAAGPERRALVDTSVIIDGRIADIAAAGFAPGDLIVPRFVLAELQNIADSDDAMRRGRGRRGLEVLNRLRELPDVTVEITDEDVSGIREVDAKLVALAQRHHCNVLTTDYNLNRVAQIQGVRVLNVNELSNAIRPVVLPGEELMVRVVQPGKERNQGVGYLADGTMIVVENGDKLIGQEVATEVTRVFQTVAGKMIFATPRRAAGNGGGHTGHGAGHGGHGGHNESGIVDPLSPEPASGTVVAAPAVPAPAATTAPTVPTPPPAPAAAPANGMPDAGRPQRQRTDQPAGGRFRGRHRGDRPDRPDRDQSADRGQGQSGQPRPDRAEPAQQSAQQPPQQPAQSQPQPQPAPRQQQRPAQRNGAGAIEERIIRQNRQQP